MEALEQRFQQAEEEGRRRSEAVRIPSNEVVEFRGRASSLGCENAELLAGHSRLGALSRSERA
eukprot:7711074-Alexandrium_andersonii.AAC.1